MRRALLLALLVVIPVSAPATVRAGADAVAKNEPALAVLAERGFTLARVEPSSLTRLSGLTVPLGRSAFAWSFSPNRSAVAIGGQDGLSFVDTRAMRLLGRMSLPRRYQVASNGGTVTFFGVQPLAWLAPRRVLVLAPPNQLLVVDPVARRVRSRTPLGGWVGRWAATRSRLVLLVHTPERIAPARLVVADSGGVLRSVPLDRIVAGSRLEDAATYRSRAVMPGLAVDPGGERAYVVGAAGTVAEVALGNLTLAYREPAQPRSLLRRLRTWLEPEARAKLSSGSRREALWLGNGVLAVTGTDDEIAVAANGVRAQVSSPAGLQLLDTRSWSVRTLDERVSSVVYSAGLLLGSGVTYGAKSGGIGVVVYELDGTRRFERFEGELVAWAGATGGYGYVSTRAGEQRGIRIVDLTDASVVTKPAVEMPVLLESVP